MTQIPAGWYPDPAPETAPGRQRYWDGTQWTDHVYDREHVPSPPSYPPAYPQANPPTYPQAYPQAYAPAMQQAVATTPDGVPLAGWWWRVLARVLDGFIALPLYAISVVPVVASQWDDLEQWVDDIRYAADHNTVEPPAPDLFNITTAPGILLVLSGLAAYLLYEIVFLFWKQATPGKLILGLRVRRRETPNLPASSILSRVGIVLLGQFCGLFLLLDYLWPLWDDKKQALHDKVARTNVVRPRANLTEGQPTTAAGLPPRW
jgi:uncharacterized RDD family membrane protein YckC